MSAPLSAVKVEPEEKKGEKAGKYLSLGAGRGAEECQGGWRRGTIMYGVGKIEQLDGRNANIESNLSFQNLIQDFSRWRCMLGIL